MPGEGAKFFPTWYQVGKSSGRLEPSCSSPPAWLIYQPEKNNFIRHYTIYIITLYEMFAFCLKMIMKLQQGGLGPQISRNIDPSL